MWYVENFFALRAHILKRNLLRKMSDILKNFPRCARLFFKELTYKYGRYISKFLRCARLFLKNVCIKISDTFENFPRCAQLFLKNSLATMDGIIWICKVSKSSTLARLIITYLYFLRNVNIFMLRKISGESFLKSTQTNPGGRNLSSYQHCERKSHVKNNSVCCDFQTKKYFKLWKLFRFFKLL